MKKIYVIYISIIVLAFFAPQLYQKYGPKPEQPEGPICHDLETPIGYLDYERSLLLDEFDGEVLIETSYESLSVQKDTYIMFTHLGKQGLFNRSCEVILDATYDEVLTAEISQDVYVIAAREDEAYYILNNEGEVISEAFDYLPMMTLRYGTFFEPLDSSAKDNEPFHLIAVKDGYYGVVNYKGEIVIPFEYEQLDYRVLSYNVYIAKKGNEYGLIDDNNELLFLYGNYEFKQRTYYDKTLNKHGVLSQDGLYYTEALYDNINDKWEDYYFVYLDQKWGVLDRQGTLLLDIRYSDVSYVYESEDYFILNDGTAYGIMDAKGDIIVPFIYDELSIFTSHSEDKTETLYKASKDGEIGLINNQNDIIIPFMYDQIEDMYYDSHVDYIIAVDNDNYGAIDFDNNIIVPFIYKEVRPYDENEILVITHNGNEEIIEYQISND